MNHQFKQSFLSRVLSPSKPGLNALAWGRHLAYLLMTILVICAQFAGINVAYAQTTKPPKFTRICWNGQPEGAESCKGQLVPNYSNAAVPNSTTDWACTKDNRTGFVWSLQVRGLQPGDGSQPWAQERVSGPLTGHGGDANRCGIASNWRVPNFKELITTADFSKTPRIDDTYFPGEIGQSFDTADPLVDVQLTVDNWGEGGDGRIRSRSISFKYGYMDDIPTSFHPDRVFAYRPVWSENIETSEILKGDVKATGGYTWYFRIGKRLEINYWQSANPNLGDAEIKLLNFNNYAGFSDWRNASIQELVVADRIGQSATVIMPGGTSQGMMGYSNRYYVESGGLVKRKTVAQYPPVGNFTLVRGRSPISEFESDHNSASRITTIDGVGGKTVCEPSGQVAYGTLVSCMGRADEGFKLDWGTNFEKDTQTNYVSAECFPINKRFSPLFQDKYKGRILKFINEDDTFNFAAVDNCEIQFQAFTQIRSLVLTEVFPPASGSLSCTGSGQDGWVKLGDSGACQATANPGYVLSSISGCAGRSAGAGSFVTGAVAQSCTVTAQLKKTQTIAFDPLVIPPFVDGGSFPLSTRATSGEAVSISAEPPGVCSVSGSTVTMHARGVCTLTLRQAGTDEIASADPVVFWIEFGDQPQISTPGKATPVPTLAHWAVMLMGLLATALTGWHLRRQVLH